MNNCCRVIIFFFLIQFQLSGQENLFELDHITTDNGLSNLLTTEIYKDAKGFIWIATPYGIDKFNGYNFSHYETESDTGHNPHTQRIEEDEQGNLWLFATDLFSKRDSSSGHLKIFLPEQGKIIDLAEYFEGDLPFEITNINLPKIIDSKKRIWITTTEGVLWLYDQGQFRKLFEEKNAAIEYLTVDEQDKIWIGWKEKIVCINQAGKVLEELNVSGRQHGIWAGEDHTLWISTINKTAEKYKVNYWVKKRGDHLLLPFTFSQNGKGFDFYIDSFQINYHFIHRDARGFWYINDQGQFDIYNEQGELIFNFKEHYKERTHNNFTNYLDDGKNIWITTPNGILKIQPKKNPFLIINSYDELSNSRGIDEDKFGNIYFINKFIHRWNADKKELSQISDEISSTYGLKCVDSLLIFGSEGTEFLVGQKNIETKKEVFYKSINGFYAFDFLESNNPGRFLIGTNKGINYLDVRQRKLFPFAKKSKETFADEILQKSKVLHFYKNEKGIWLATDNGLFLINETKGVLAHYNKNNSELPFNYIRFIHEDKAGIFWLASRGGGLIKWQPAKIFQERPSLIQQFTTENGLSNNYTYAVYEDDHNRLWIPSDNGLMCMDKNTQAIKTYRVSDGLPHNEFNLTAHCQAKDGTLYLGGLGGVISFQPNELFDESENHTPLEIVSCGLLENDAEKMTDKLNSLKTTNQIIFKPTDKLLELKFALLDFDNTSYHRYAYQIEGYDDRWQFISENYIRLPHLPYGNYTLKVKGQNINSGWSDKELAVEVDFKKPFYLEYWFLTCLFLASIGFIVFIIKRRELQFQENQRVLEEEVKKRTQIIEEDKQTILAQSESLKELDKAKTQFFSNITHELRTPLTLIMGPTEQIVSAPELPSVFRNRLNIVLKNARHLSNLINQMLDLAKIEGGHMKLNATQGDVIAYTQKILNRFEAHVDAKNQKLIFEAEPSVWKTQFDKDKWDKIVYNLLSNAIKFTDRGGIIQVNLKRNFVDNKEWIEFEIKDNGIGIKENQLPQIFNRFHQVDNSDTRVNKGTGIGLALLKELVELQNGEITVMSKVGMGTAFRISLPVLELEHFKPLFDEPSDFIAVPDKLQKTLEQDQPLVAVEEQEDKKLELLIIEDNSEIRAYIRSCIDTSKYNIHEANDGEDGIEKAQAIIPDLIITDLMMPKKNGYQVVSAIRNNVATSHIPLIILTAKASLESRLKGLKRGADAYLTKPFSQQELIIRIQKLIEIRQLLQKRYENGAVIEIEDTFQQEDEFIVNIRTYILDNIDEPKLNGDIIGKHFGMSRVHLYRKLKVLSNQSISELVKEIRLIKAMELLQNGKLNISEIAFQTGFSSVSAFSTFFKKTYGKAPSKISDSTEIKK